MRTAKKLFIYQAKFFILREKEMRRCSNCESKELIFKIDEDIVNSDGNISDLLHVICTRCNTETMLYPEDKAEEVGMISYCLFKQFALYQNEKNRSGSGRFNISY